MKAGAVEFSPSRSAATICCQRFTRPLSEIVSRLARAAEDSVRKAAKLTARERDVLELVAAGRLNKEIAAARHRRADGEAASRPDHA